MTPLDFLRAGVQFTWTSVPSKTSTGHAFRAHVLTVRGPRDEALLAQLKSEIERRMPMVEDLHTARRQVVQQRIDAGLPMGKSHKTGAPMLPPGVCETCGEGLPTVLSSGEVHMTCGGGMCPLCVLSRQKVLQRM